MPNKKQNVYLILFVLVALMPMRTSATSGACSWHWGVNCDAGADWDGSVVCNDGWRDSGVSYSLSCDNDEDSCPRFLDSNSYYSMLNQINESIEQIRTDTSIRCLDALEAATDITNRLYQSCLSYNSSMRTIAMRSGSEPINLRDCESEKSAEDTSDNNDFQLCLTSDDYTILQYEGLKACMAIDTFDYCSLEIPNSKTVNGACQCNDGYSYDSERTHCVKHVTCADLVNGFVSNGQCYCYSGYQMDGKGICNKIEPKTAEIVRTEDRQEEKLVQESGGETEAEIIDTGEEPIVISPTVTPEETTVDQTSYSLENSHGT